MKTKEEFSYFPTTTTNYLPYIVIKICHGLIIIAAR